MRWKMLLAVMALLVSNQPAIAQEAPDATEAARTVQAHVDAYRARNLDRFIATFAPDATVVANGMVAIGRDEIRALYQLNFAPGAPEIRIIESGMNGDRVYLSILYIFADGGERCCSYSEYTVKDGKIISMTSRG